MNASTSTGRRRGLRAAGLATVVVAGGLGGVIAAASPSQAGIPDCVAGGPFTALNSECQVPGTAGSGRMRSLYGVIDGGGGGSETNGDYASGGAGSRVYTWLSVPEGTVLTLKVGQGGQASEFDQYSGAGGGGSTAVLIGSRPLVVMGGGGGAGGWTDFTGGEAAFTGPIVSKGWVGNAGSEACAGKGGNNTSGSPNGGAGGAAGTLSAPCNTGAHAGVKGGTGPKGAGGAGGSQGGIAAAGGTGGAGYAAGGNGGGSTGSPGVFAGAGGGGAGYGGGGGGTFVNSVEKVGAGGGGGAWVDLTATGVQSFLGYDYPYIDSAGNEGEEQYAGGPGKVEFSGQSGTVVTEQSVPTGITTSSAVLHSMVNPNNAGDATVTVKYATNSTLSSGVHTATLSPGVVTDGSTDTNVLGTVASGLKACTTYYYQASIEQTSMNQDPGPISKGTVESFKTPDCQLPLKVKAKSASYQVPRSGSTVLVTSAKTSHKGKIRTTVSCTTGRSTRGDVRFCGYRVGRHGKVTVTTYGFRGVKITITQRAVAKPGKTTASSPLWKRSWHVK